MTKAQKVIKRVAKSKAKEIMADKSIKRSERKAITSRILAEAQTQVEAIDKSRNVVGKEIPTCYVCGRQVKLNPVYVCGNLFRHSGCCAGSPRWMKSDIGRASKYRNLFKEVEGVEDDGRERG